MPAHEHRRVVNQNTPTVGLKTEAEWEALRRALLMVIAQFKETDSASGYTIEVRVVHRDRAKQSA